MEESTNFCPEFAPFKEGGYWYQDIVVLNRNGLHARPSAVFYEKVLQPNQGELNLDIKINGPHGSDGFLAIRSVFDLMALGLDCGTRFTIRLAFTGDAGDEKDPEVRIAQDIHRLFTETFVNQDAHEKGS